MGTITQTTVFTTEDGVTHTNLQDAQQYDQRLDLINAIAKEFQMRGKVQATASELADWLIANYSMEPLK